MRTSPIHYIAPSSIEITPNANNSYNDLVVYVAPNTSIKVYCPKLGIGIVDNDNYNTWSLTGRNRRLADDIEGYANTKPYTIYARLEKQNQKNGYIVFAPKQQYGGQWYDKYSYVTKDGLSISFVEGIDGRTPAAVDDPTYWYVKIGDVTQADNTKQRDVTLDTGILGTDGWNSEWALNPDALPLRIDMKYLLGNIVGEEWSADVRYVRWGQILHVNAKLIEGWTGTDITRFHHWEITRNTGNTDADNEWNAAHDGQGADSGNYTSTEFDLYLAHTRGQGDDFLGMLSAIFTFTAYEINPDYTPDSGLPAYLPLIRMAFSVMAETVEVYDMEESSGTVTYNPQTGEYSPAIEYNEQTHQYSPVSGVTVRVRARDADGNTFYPTTEQISALNMHVYYQPIDDEASPTELPLVNGRGTLPSAPFLAGKSVDVWMQIGTWNSSDTDANIILSRKTITYIRFGAKGDTPINCYRWYKEGLTPLKPTDTSSDEPAPAPGDATGLGVWPANKWSAVITDRPSSQYLLWMCSSIRRSDNTRDAWAGPVRISGVDGTPGEDAADREYIYQRTTSYPYSGTPPANIKKDTSGVVRTDEYIATHDDFVPQGWSDAALPATEDEKYVYVSIRIKPAGTDQSWGAFSAPVLWTNWGEQGTDGDGVQYLYKLFDHELSEQERTSLKPSGATYDYDTKKWSCNGWSDNPMATTTSLPFCYCSVIQRIDGTWGTFGKLGLWGKWSKDGESITKESETYYYIKNTTGTRPPADDSNWSETKPTLNKGEWLFTKIVITWSDDSETIIYTDERNPNDGQPGQDIIVDGATVMKYYVSENNAQHPADDSSDWKEYSQIILEKGKWLWAQAKTNYKRATDGSAAGSTYNYNVSYIGTDGQDGQDGRSIVSITEYYKASANASGETAPSDDSGWDTDPSLSRLPAASRWNEANKYLWNYEKIIYSSGTLVERTTPQILAIWTKDGAAGKGIDSIVNYYKVTNTATPPFRPQKDDTEGWSSTPVAPGQGEYLWNYEKIIWLNPADTTYTDVQQIGYAGTDGQDGTSVIAQYSVDGTSNWHSTFAAGDKYMRTSADSGTTWGSAIKIVGEDGTDGHDGENGDYIDSSFGISSKLVGDNQDGSPSDISSWSDAPIATTEQKPYLWCKQVSHTFSGSTETVGTPKYFRMTGENGKDGEDGDDGADAIVYKIEFTDKTFALNPNTGKNVISIKGAVYKTEGSNTTKVDTVIANDFALRYVKSDGSIVTLNVGSDYGIQNGEFYTSRGDGQSTDYKNFIVEYKPDGTNILAQNSLPLTVYGEKGMDAITGYADYLYSEDDAGNSRPAASAEQLGKIDLLRYSGNQNRIAICEQSGSGYEWKGYGKSTYPDGTMFVCSLDNHLYRATASGWQDEGRFKGDNAVVYKIDFTDNTFALDQNTGRNVVDIKGIVYKTDGGNTTVFTGLTSANLKLYFLHNSQDYDYDPVENVTISNGAFSTTERSDSGTTGEKALLAIVKINNIEVARASIPRTLYAARGKRNRSYYYAQPWENTSRTYLVNDAQAPFFEYLDEYYVYNPVDDVEDYVAMNDMGVPSTTNPNWQLIDNNFKYIITEALFGEFARLGSFVINGNWLFSQEGIWRDDENFNSNTPISYYILPYTEGDRKVSASPYTLINEEEPETAREAIFTEMSHEGTEEEWWLTDQTLELNTEETYVIWAGSLSNVVLYLRKWYGTGEYDYTDSEIPMAVDETTQVIDCLFKVEENGKYDIVAKPSPTGYRMKLTDVNMYKLWFSPNAMINGKTGKAVMNHLFGSRMEADYGRFNFAHIKQTDIGKMHTGTYDSSNRAWVDIDGKMLDISRYSKVRVVEWNTGGVTPIGYVYIDNSGALKVSSIEQDFYNPNKGSIPAN